MAAVRGKNTKPELKVRSAIHRSGFRFSLYRKDLPGKPDLVLPKYKTVIFVHGCFWHGHDCPRGKRPATRKEFWNDKLEKNELRDQQNIERLEAQNWCVLVIWECNLKDGIDDAIRMLKMKKTSMASAA